MDAYYNCLRCMNQKVRILTMDGNQYVGTIMDVDRNNVYLKPESKGCVRTSGFGFNEQILTLSLFTLLAIALI
jgi:hypothetical protein